MPRLSFIFPSFLWLLLLLPPLWALAWLAPRRLAHWRFRLSVLLRTLGLLALILGLAGAQLARPIGAVTTVFLLDGSDSIALSQRARAETLIGQALADMPRDDRAAIVVFGQRALVERTPSGDRALGQVTTHPGGSATNIQDALQLGLALLPDEGRQRLVLLSDGGQNAGDAPAAARLAAARGVPIDVIALSGVADGLDAQISSVELPAASRRGQRLTMRIDLESNAATSGRLTVVGPDGAPLVDQQVQAPQGSQQLVVSLPAALPAFNRYVVRFDVPNDARPENNAAEAYSFASDQPRVLLVEGAPGEAAALAGALAAARIETSIVAPARVPTDLGSLSAYDAVALVNVPKSALPERAQALLPVYVHDLGRGLLMVGGDQSFGAGGWRRTPIEAALPVSMDIPTQVRFPPVSIVVLIDVSGSMSALEGGRSKISLAAEGAQRIAALMRDEDELTVIPFDTQAERVIGPLPGNRRDEAIDALSQIQSGGGGIYIHDGLAEAASYIRRSDKPGRHIITISDGSDTEQHEGALELARQLHDERVTISTVSVGDGPDTSFLTDLARVGAGRMFLTDQASNLPSILADDAQAAIQPYIIEETFTPARGSPHPILKDVEQTPPLHGYVLATPRQTAQVLLSGPRGEPVLAAWQYGLGRAVAWTSDFKGAWGKDWVAWDQFPRVSARLFGWLLPAQGPQNLTLQAGAAGDELVLTAQAQDELGRPQTGLQLSGRLLGADGAAFDVALREVGPGEYRAAVVGARPGAYLAQIVARDARGQPFGAVTAGAVVPQSVEYRSRGANPALLDALVRDTGGRMNPDPARMFDPNGDGRRAVQEIGLPLLWLALILLPLDVGVRRLLFGRDQAAQLARRMGLGRLLGAPQAAAAQQSARAPSPPAEPAQPRTTPARPPPVASAPTAPASDLERLRAAQERARRRARGEE